jgi:hypothetical protein
MVGPMTEKIQESEDAEKVQTIYKFFYFIPLWRHLGDYLSMIEEKLEHIMIVLLPLMKVLMVVCKYIGSRLAVASGEYGRPLHVLYGCAPQGAESHGPQL